MIKVLFVTHSLGSGGAERVFSILMNHLDKSKFEVECVLLNKITHALSMDEDVKITELESSSFRSSIFKVSKYIKSSKPDIVIGTVAPVNLLLALVKKKLFYQRSRPIYILRESTVLSEFQKLKGLKNRLLIKMVSWFYPTYDKIICQSQDIKNDLISNFGIDKNQLVLINNPVMTKQFSTPSMHQEGRVQKLVTVGRLRKEKGIDRLISIIHEYKSRTNNRFHYYILGDGDEENTQNATLKINHLGLQNEITLMGHFKDPVEFIKDADIFLQGSFFEGFPNAVLESCSVGVPVLAFNVPGGTKEIIQHGKNGFLIQDGNINEYVESLLNMDENTFDREVIKADIKERFSIPKIVGTYEKLFLELNQ